MGEQILRYTVILGDWSDDGHGKTSKRQIEFFSESSALDLTEELIVSNYQTNRAILGFGIEDLWADYEQFSPTPDQIEKLREELGAVYYVNDSVEDLEEAGLYGKLRSDEELGEGPLPVGSFYLGEYNNQSFLDVKDSMELIMFIVLHGLPEVGWRTVEEPPKLFGGYNTPLVGSEAVAYGRYS